MTKKYFTFTLLCALILLSSIFIHSKNQEPNEKKKYEWKLVSVYPPDLSIYQNGMEKFVKDVEAISQGQLEIDIYTKGENVPIRKEKYKIIKAEDVFDVVREDNDVQMGFGTSPYWAKEKIPAGELMYAIPFGLKAKDMYAWLMQGRGLELWREMYAPFNVIPFPVGDTGGAMGGWFREKIETIQDFKGMKIRNHSFSDKIFQSEEIGAIPQNIPSMDSLGSYNSKDIDAIICLGPYGDRGYKVHRGPKYYYYPGWQEPCGVISLIINKKAFEGLPSHLRKTIEIVCSDTYRFISNGFDKMNSEVLQDLKKEGVEFIKFPPEVLHKFRKITMQVLEKEAKNETFNRVYQSFKKFKENNVDSGWEKMVDEAVYPEKMSKIINELNNSSVATAMEKGNNCVIISLSGDASFASNSVNPKEALIKEIARIVELIDEYSVSKKVIRIEGHTDSQGDEYKNWSLSKDRANAVVDLLTDNGVKKSLIKPVFYGEAVPIADNNTPQGRRKNRRVEIIIEF